METLDRPDGSKWVCACGETITYSSYSQLRRKLEEARLARDAAHAEVERWKAAVILYANHVTGTAEYWITEKEHSAATMAALDGDLEALEKALGVKP